MARKRLYAPRLSKKIIDQMNFKWSDNNDKLLALSNSTGRRVLAFNLLAGYTCPAASICQAWSRKSPDGQMVLGKHAEFVCFAAAGEQQYTNSYNAHKFNTDRVVDVLRDKESGVDVLASLIDHDIKISGVGIVRIHSSGDLFSPAYALTWVKVAQMNPDVLFFGYTKVYASYQIINRVNLPNLAVVFSVGSRDDKLLKSDDVTATVIVSSDMAESFPHAILCANDMHYDDYAYSEDFHYVMSRRSFGLWLH